jgi:ArsR family transcriptional regulator
MIDIKTPAPPTNALDCCAPLTTTALTVDEADDLAAVFAALSDPVRLRLLSIVAAEGEVCSCNLEAPLGKRQSTISHHTSVLSAAQLISGTRRGRWMYWSVVPERLALIASLLGEASAPGTAKGEPLALSTGQHKEH